MVAAFCLLLSGAGTWSAISVTTVNGSDNVTAGTVSLLDNDAGTTMYSVSNAGGGESVTKCMTVTYAGSLASDLKLYASAVGALGAYIDFTIQKGTGTPGDDCVGFTPGPYVYGGTLKGFADAHTNWATGWELRPNGGTNQVVFQAYRDGNLEIYKMASDGSGQTRLTNDGGNDRGAVWSPDGTRILFGTDRHGADDELYTMDPDGTNLTRLTNNSNGDGSPRWSPDGSRITFDTDRDSGNWEVYAMDANGANQTRLTNNGAGDFGPDWSPDGTRIAFTSDRDGNEEVYVMNANGTSQTRLTNNGASDARPTWSPDGTKLTFTSTRDGNEEVYVMNADGTGQTRLTNDGSSDRGPVWSPDGTKILFTSHRDGNDEIYSMDPNGANPTNLTNQGDDDDSPSWQVSPAPSSWATSNSVAYRLTLNLQAVDAIDGLSTGSHSLTWEARNQ